ncbi:MAG: GDP-mannose dehydrogenase [Thaumarchaeota archaeon]|nr:GDP-mannose dehydrogenase [Nitrososphaerota archaeon]
MSERILIIGLGEVGRPLYEILSEKFTDVYGYDSDRSKTIHELKAIPKPIEIMHIAYPYTGGEFIDSTINYIRSFNPRLVIIHSSIPPRTTRLIQSKTNSMIAYSPVRGKHPNLKEHLRFWTKWISAVNQAGTELAKRHLEEAGFKVKVAKDPESLELAKLWETIYRAAMIACWQEIHRISKDLGADIKVIAEFIQEVHEVLGDRPLYYPDVIGGHCLIPNTRILAEIVDSDLLSFILKSNELRSEEIKDPKIAEEVEALKEIWKKLIPRSYYHL